MAHLSARPKGVEGMRAEDEKSQQSLGHKLWNRTLLTTVALHSVALHCFMGLQRSRANKRPQTWQRCSLACPVPPLPNQPATIHLLAFISLSLQCHSMAPKKQSNAKTAPKAAHSKSAALSPKPQAKQGIHPLPLSFHTTVYQREVCRSAGGAGLERVA